METDLTAVNNPWKDIPIADYEEHMSHLSIGQLSLLNSLTKKYLERYKPATCLFVGVAGGNGLEHVSNNITKSVIGVDINRQYLDICWQRYHHKMNSLELVQMDISKDTT